MLDIAGSVIRLMELKHKERTKSVMQPEVTWSANLQQDIVQGIKKAEKEVLKTMEEMGMIPGLRAANVVYQNQRTGEITMLNSASSAFVSNTTFFPDEENMATFEELFDLDNNILLDNLQKDSTTTTEQIAEIIADARGTEEKEEEELDEGDPRNCEFYKVGTCKFLQRGFVEPAMTHWIGCEFPNCGKWWHELCLGIKFQNDEERNRYSFICPNHDCNPDDLFSAEKPKATREDKSVLCGSGDSFAQTSEQHKERQKQHRETNKEQYVEYNGEVYHISNFLSLQIGNAYVPSSGRLSRWLSTSRCDFYDSIESRLNSDKADFTLRNFIALFVPGIGLTIGKVTRIIRTLKASTSFPILHVDKDSSKLPGLTEVGILVFDGDKKESDDPPRTYKETGRYIWCNRRECILVLNGEADNSRFVMTEQDHRFISERLPALKAAESKRAKQEEKEKHEKIAKLKAGDPKDMTVILLREVLMEMGVSFKSSESKAKLIEKVTQVRQVQNDTCDERLLVTVTSTDSASLHTEELCEVPGNSIRSLFGHKNNALSTSSSTIIRARDNITLDTQEISLHEHLIIYFDFDLRKKIILLLHLLFILSIMTVRCSQTSNILTLVHLVLSWSLLIVQDEFERIMYIVGKIFFIIIQLLYAVACVAVSNLLVFLHKSNTWSCHFAIVS